jgi:hypothetical protein
MQYGGCKVKPLLKLYNFHYNLLLVDFRDLLIKDFRL